MENNLFWNSQEKSIKGSFVSLCLTIFIVVLIGMGIFNDEICESLKKLESLITWFFGLSWGIYTTKSVADKYIEKDKNT